MRAGIGPQHVAAVHVAVQAQHRQFAGSIEAAADAVEGLIDHRQPGFAQFRRQEGRLQQLVPRLFAEVLDGQVGPVGEGLAGADGVDAAEKTSQPGKHFRVVEFRRPSAATLEEGDAEAFMLVQRFAVDLQGRHGGDFGLGQFGQEGVLFEDRRVAPPARPVELGDQRGGVFDADLVDPVFVAVEGQQAAVATEARGLHRGEDEIRRERPEGGCHCWLPSRT